MTGRDRVRVLVKSTGHVDHEEGYMGWRFDCYCGDYACDGQRFNQAIRYARTHAGYCPTLHLAHRIEEAYWSAVGGPAGVSSENQRAGIRAVLGVLQGTGITL